MEEILTYTEMNNKEKCNLVRGMNFRPSKKTYSIPLMSTRKDAPFKDGFDNEGKLLYYEGEDVSKREKIQPKDHDQSFFKRNGKLTNNGIFLKLAEDFKLGRREEPEKIMVYEKINNNVWSNKGFFNLVDAFYQLSEHEGRKVFKFVLSPLPYIETKQIEKLDDFEFSRRIPTEIKQMVWERDGGKCSFPGCGATINLHFDHIIPWSKGGSSKDSKNIQILCARHNLTKSDKIV